MQKEIKPIVLKARTAENSVGVVRLSPEAEKVVRRLCNRSGLPIKQIVWCEALDGRQKDMTYTDAVEINGILEAAAGWVRSKNGIRCGYCGLQKGFLRR